MSRIVGGALVTVLAGSLVVGACSDDEKQVCKDREALQTSFQDLRDVNVLSDGLDAFTEAFDDVESDAEELVDSAQDEFGDDADAVKSALDDLRAAVDTATSDGLGGGAGQDVVTAAGALGDAVQQLVDGVKSACD